MARDFKILTLGGKEYLTIQSDKIPECMDFFANNNFDGIRIAPTFGFKSTTINFLKDYPEVNKKIREISLAEEITDISSLELLSELRYLIIGCKNPKIDFCNFQALEYLNVAGENNLSNLELCRNLRSLTIYYYNPKSKDFSRLQNISWIKELTISNSNITSLGHLEKLNNLEKASFNYCAKLERLCCLEVLADKLKILQFDSCKKISNHHYVKMLKKLEILAFNDCGSISSLSFIKNMSSLKDIRFVETDVVDGDLTPLLNLDYAGFSNKRHFSHSFETVKLLTEKRTEKKRSV